MEAEEEWIERIKRGEREALRPLMNVHGDRVKRTAILLLGNTHDAEDISQEVFLTVYRKIAQLKESASIEAWITQITINCCRAFMRRSAWKRLFYREKIEDEPRFRGTIESNEEHLVQRLDLGSCVAGLPYKYRVVIVLHYYRDWSVADMADVLGLPESTVKTRLVRARQRLQTIIEEREGII